MTRLDQRLRGADPLAGRLPDPLAFPFDASGEVLSIAYEGPRRRLPARSLGALAVGAIAGVILAIVVRGVVDEDNAGRRAPAAGIATPTQTLPRPGEPGGPPAPVIGAPHTIEVLDYPLHRPEGRAEVRRRLRPYGIRLEVRTKPVAPAAVGRVFGVQFPHRARFDPQHRLVLERGVGGAIVITLGRHARSGEHVDTEGLSLYEALPQVADAVDVNDPAATGRRLAELGFTIHWELVVDDPADPPTASSSVSRPPEGTKILSVLNAQGENSATPDTRTLLIEITPRDSEIGQSHP
jgi:hypothetical protein